MDTKTMSKLPFFDVYYKADPIEAYNFLQATFNDSTMFHEQLIVLEAFLFFVKTARKYGFQIFFTAPTGFFNEHLAESFENGYKTPEIQCSYKRPPDFIKTGKFN